MDDDEIQDYYKKKDRHRAEMIPFLWPLWVIVIILIFLAGIFK